MPVVLVPTPQRIHITRENYDLGRPATLVLPPGTGPEVGAALRRELEALFPELVVAASRRDPDQASLRFGLFPEEGGAPADVPERLQAEAFRLQVSPERIEVVAGSPMGWMMAARLLRALRERDELVGVALTDWPTFEVRQVDLPWPAAAMCEAALQRWLDLMALARFNRLGLPPDPEGRGLPAALPNHADERGVALVEVGSADAGGRRSTFRLLEAPTLFPAYSALLPALQETARAAAESGKPAFHLSLGAVDSQTSLEALVYGLLFAGDCAWNPRRADLKAFRRWYSMRRFGFDSRGPVQTIDELEAAATLPAGSAGREPGVVSGSGTDTALSAALEAEDPFDAPLFASVLRPEEWAEEMGRRAAAALAALAPLQPDSEDRAAALQGLQWTAQRLKRLGSRLVTIERVRELYRSAFVASASPKAVSQRLLRAAEFLDTEARALEEHRAEWHALWRRERSGPYDPDTEAAQRARVEALGARAAHLRELRNRYIQTGTLPSPVEEELERPGTRLSAGLQPARLPPLPSPAWWPEGGAARLRVEVECPEAAAGIPWEVQADFRALAGEAGAFNVRSARLTPLTEADEAGPERPCQLVRGGFVFIADPGRHTYYLYLDPQPGPDSGFRETRASQSRAGVRLENRWMQLRLSAAYGFVSGWRLLEPGLDLLPTEEDLEEGFAIPETEWRLRVLETGPLLARARAEHPDGRIRQLDLPAGQPWAELSVNAPWTEFLLPDRAELWPEGAVALFGVDETHERWPLSRTAAEVSSAHWAAQHRLDGLTVAALLPESPAHATIAVDGLRFWGRPGYPPKGGWIGRVLLFAGIEEDPAGALGRLLAAQRHPPRLRLGVVDERRVREF